MSTYSLLHLADGVLLRDLATLVARERTNTAALLAHIAEVDTRKLYARAGYHSMHAYCMGELRLSEDAAAKRVHAANTARRIPAIFTAVADGRLHLSAVVMLARRLSPENADDLIAAATHKSKSEIEHLLACRYPRADVPTRIVAIPAQPAPMPRHDSPGPAPVSEGSGPLTSESAAVGMPSWDMAGHAPGRVAPSAHPPTPDPVEARARSIPLSPEKYQLSVTIDRSTQELLESAQCLLRVHRREVAPVLRRALELLVRQLEKRKFAATDKPHETSRRASKNPRQIPADVKREVWKRDGGRCTFVGDTGHRCESRHVEFDHIEPVARGGKATVANLRLLCRAHNQHAAECALGSGFMKDKREAARQATARKRATREIAKPGTQETPEQRALAIAAAEQARARLSVLFSEPTGPPMC